jgi:hypothetical protein
MISSHTWPLRPVVVVVTTVGTRAPGEEFRHLDRTPQACT